MALQITPNQRTAGNLNITANQRARMASVLAIDWNNVTGKPSLVVGLAGVTGTGIFAVTDLSGGAATRTITGTANQITVTNGDGVAGNPIISTPAALTFTGKTVTGGTFNSATIAGATITTSSYNGNTWTAGTGILTIAALKTLTANATLTLAGTDGKSLTLTTGLTVSGNDGTLSFGAASKTLTVNNSLTLAGTDATTMTFPTTSATLARTDAANTFTGHQTIEGVTSTGATGTGKFVFDGTPTLVTPVLGVATATTINKVTFTTPATAATLTILNNKTATFNNSITFAGTDATTMNFPTTTATIARTDTGQTFTGTQTVGGLLANTTTGVGYTTGSGAAVTQLTSRATGVTINAPTGAITMFSAAGSATPASFTVTNSAVAATDVVQFSQKSGTNLYNLLVTSISAGSFTLVFFTTGGTATDAPVLNFAVIKGSAS